MITIDVTTFIGLILLTTSLGSLTTYFVFRQEIEQS